MLNNSKTIFAFAVLCFLAPGVSAQSSSSIAVGATVLPYTTIKIVSTPNQLELSPADLAQGFKLVEQPLEFTVKTNFPQAATALIVFQSEVVDMAVASGLPSPLQISLGTSFMALPAKKPFTEAQYNLTFKLKIAATAKAGMYPWPIRILSQSSSY
jgi:hypothetical protein